MERWRKAFLLIFLLTRASSLTIDDVTDAKPSVILSRGAAINELHWIEVYDEMQFVFFLIPDIPDPPQSTNVTCYKDMESRLCKIYNESKQALKDVRDSLKVANKILTTKGLNEEIIINATVNKEWFDTIPAVDLPSEYPNGDIQQVVGPNYVSEVQLRLALRKILETNGTETLKIREARSIQKFMKPILKFAAKALASGELQEFFTGLFTGDNGILSVLTCFRAASPEDRKEFAELSSKISEYEYETRKLLADVLQNTNEIEKQLREMQDDTFTLSAHVLSFKEMILLQQSLIADAVRLLYVSNIYGLHFQAFSDCRDGNISPTFVPLPLLADKLYEIYENMPEDKTFVIPPYETFRLYKLRLAECIYDSKGGLMKIGIPLRRKKAAYKLFEYKPIQFAFNEYTCALETEATLIIKDTNGNDVFPITELDAESCDVSTNLCKLPVSTDMDTSSICIAILLKGYAGESIRENCKLQCTKRSKPEIARISDDVFVGVHLPDTGIEIRCPTETIPFTKSIPVGSTRFTLTCTQCKLYWKNVLVGSASGKPCKTEKRPKIETLFPIQFSDLKDIKPDGEDGEEKNVFVSTAEIANSQYNPETGTDYPPFDMGAYVWGVVDMIWDGAQSLLIMYMFYKNRYLLPAVGVGINHAVAGVQADRYACKLTTDVYLMLWAIIVLLLLAVVPYWLTKFCKCIRNHYDDTIKTEALRQELQRREEMQKELEILNARAACRV